MSKAYLCVITKNEGRDLAEWLLFHLFLGFKKIIVYDNNSTDSTNELVRSCMAYGSIEYVFWPKPFSQIKAYNDCLKRFGKECDWMAFLDVDEFLVLPKHRRIDSFLDSMAIHKAIGLNWRIFGSNGEKFIKNDLVTATFLNRAPDSFSANRHIKSILRPEITVKALNPHFFLLKRVSLLSFRRHEYVNSSGQKAFWLKPGKTLDTGDSEIAVIHHYFTKSEEHYQKKLLRGNADKKAKRMDVFKRNDRNELIDTSIIDFYKKEIEKIKEIMKSI